MFLVCFDHNLSLATDDHRSFVFLGGQNFYFQSFDFRTLIQINSISYFHFHFFIIDQFIYFFFVIFFTGHHLSQLWTSLMVRMIWFAIGHPFIHPSTPIVNQPILSTKDLISLIQASRTKLLSYRISFFFSLVLFDAIFSTIWTRYINYN